MITEAVKNTSVEKTETANRFRISAWAAYVHLANNFSKGMNSTSLAF